MLVRGEKPKREPLISVGLILPMDKQNSITIYNDLDQKRYFIESENDHLLVNGEKTEKINLIGSSKDQIFTLDRVPAGRGFHWEKNISIQVVGSLDISNNNGYLFVINQINLESYLMCVATVVGLLSGLSRVRLVYCVVSS